MSSVFFPRGVPLEKRLFDLLLTLPGLALVSPILLAVSLVVWISDGRPVLFRQPRPGYRGKIFQNYKFRSMNNRTDADGKLLPDEQRVSAIGHFLRASSLDELPELFNVVRGEMSLVGPRPLLVAYLERYSPEQMRRHDVLPGVTGWAQVNGRNAISWEEKFSLDVWYVDHWSLWLDMKILAMTFLKVFKREGIHPAGRVSVEEFKGDK
jgi:sugar transferase EpsL